MGPILPSLENDLALAHHLAGEAIRVSLSCRRSALKERLKPDGTLVTNADEAVEDALRFILTTERPNDAVLGEERGMTGCGSRRWLLDGIDGTTAFVRGESNWATLIALEIDAEVVVGVSVQPERDLRCWASLNCGSYAAHNARLTPPRRLKVTETSDITCGQIYVEKRPDQRDQAVATRLDEMGTVCASDDHPALLVAQGRLDVAVFFECGPWDIAAPLIIVEEAGGQFSDCSGGRSLHRGVGMFTNGLLHDAVLRILNARP